MRGPAKIIRTNRRHLTFTACSDPSLREKVKAALRVCFDEWEPVEFNHEAAGTIVLDPETIAGTVEGFIRGNEGQLRSLIS